MAVQEPSIDHLERLHTDFLFAIPSFFSSTSNNTKQKLLDVFAVILKQEYFKANLAWFVVWDKSIDEEYPESYFLRGDDSKARKVVNMYKSSEWIDPFSKYVTIPSKFCVRNRIEDTSFIFAAEDFGVERVNNRYLVPLNLKDIVSEITMRDSDISRNMKHGLEEKVIKELEYYHSQLGKNDNLITPIFKALQGIFPETAITKERVAKLLNCYFWLGLAYPEDWKTMLYFPGIIAKKVESVPFGVNIGFRKLPSMDVILFLKKITLLFFTRKAVNFFEEQAEKEAGRRIRDVNNLNKLLSDFQHTILQSIIDSIRYFMGGSASEHSCIDKLLTYVSRRGTYLDQLSDFIATTRRNNIRAVTFNRSALESEFIDSGIFIRKIISQASTISDSINEWRNIFKPKAKLESDSNINIEGICWGPIQTIIENLIANSLNYAFFSEKETRIYIRFCKLYNNQNKETYPAIIYWDDGKGFEKKVCNNIPRWYETGPTLSEGRKGYAYWLIGKIMDHVGGELKLLIYANHNSLLQLNNNNLYTSNYIMPICEEFLKKNLFNNKNLENGNCRVIHILAFKNKYWPEIPV